MSDLKNKTRRELYEEAFQDIRKIKTELNFLRKQVSERDLRIQLYQFSNSKLAELKNHLQEFPNLAAIWQEFEIAYKLATGKNLIQFKELEEKQNELNKKLNDII